MMLSHWSLVRDKRGVVLGLIIITSVIFGIAAFGILMLAMSRMRQSNYLGEDRLRAQYAAEAGIVKAMQELWRDSTDCAFGPASDGVYTITDGTNTTTVTVTAVGCPPAKLQAKVTF
jgi:Tfp pilus assembly protein PilX